MPRRTAVLSVLGVLALVALVGLVTDIFGPGEPQVMINRHTGKPLTLESVMHDLEWHRETAHKLRKSD